MCRGVTRISGGDSGLPVVVDLFQRGYGCSGAQLGTTGRGSCDRTRWEGEGGASRRHLLLPVRWPGNVH